MKLYIKNMVCDRCKLVVFELLKKLEIDYNNLSLGELELRSDKADEPKMGVLKSELEALGFELIYDKNIRIVEAIKHHVIALVQDQDGIHHTKLSKYVTSKMPYEFSYLSKLFSSIEGMTLERFFILQKIEKVKELIVYGELSLTEISFQTGYSSLAHLSKQFKSVTSISLSEFRKSKNSNLRNSLDKIPKV